MSDKLKLKGILQITGLYFSKMSRSWKEKAEELLQNKRDMATKCNVASQRKKTQQLQGILLGQLAKFGYGLWSSSSSVSVLNVILIIILWLRRKCLCSQEIYSGFWRQRRMMSATYLQVVKENLIFNNMFVSIHTEWEQMVK